MYLAPLNYDRFFKKVFSDPEISRKFLEDFLDIEIDSLEIMGERHKVTDDAAFVEFDFRCRIRDAYIIIDMQQWYVRWFDFAERTRNEDNTSDDFGEFRGDRIFDEMMNRLDKTVLTDDDMEYIRTEKEGWDEVRRYERGHYEDGRKDGWEKGWEDGREEGRKEGRKESHIEFVKKILGSGKLDMNEIADISELSIDELKKL